ncbi:hypothetical protein SNE40_019259 [Patella caerulea]|uniref:Fibrinogen C-terminal domain-containing protein n=1 Tax=Patella caerulea TaxID=87958 RepID=A0AAN8JAE4_PATCE
MGVSIPLLVIRLLQTFVVVSASIDSKYIKTSVLEESSYCKDRGIYGLILQEIKCSLIDCSRFCSKIDNCRRFMFDNKDNHCSLYESSENCFTSEDLSKKMCFRLISVCDDVNCTRCPIGYYGDQCQNIIEDCSDGTQKGVVPDKKMMSFIRPSPDGPVLELQCDFRWGGLTVIQSRTKSCLEVDFNRTWHDYSVGFGYRHGNYWIGLENVHRILQNHPKFKLGVLLVHDSPMGPAQGYYHGFNISNNADNYKITIDSYSPNSKYDSGDSLTNGSYNINGRPFSTYDKDSSNNDCPGRFGGGWWYIDDPVCSRANVNGKRDSVGDTFEATWHWLDNLGNITNYRDISLLLNRE